MVQVVERIEHPGLAPPVGNVLQGREETIAHGRVRRQRRPHELHARLAVGIGRPRDLLVEDLLGVRSASDCQLLRERDVVRFGEHQTGNVLRCAPHTLDPLERRRCQRDAPQRVEPRRLQARAPGLVEAAPQQRFERRRARAPLALRNPVPVSLADVAEHALHGLLVPFGGHGAHQRVQHPGRADSAVEHLFPQRDEDDAAAQIVLDGVEVGEQIVAAAAVEDEVSVGDTVRVREGVERRAVAARQRNARALGVEPHPGLDWIRPVDGDDVERLRPQ